MSRLRFVTERDAPALVEMWHLSRTALAGRPAEQRTEHARRSWAAGAFAAEHSGVTSTGAYKDLEALLTPEVMANRRHSPPARKRAR